MTDTESVSHLSPATRCLRDFIVLLIGISLAHHVYANSQVLSIHNSSNQLSGSSHSLSRNNTESSAPAQGISSGWLLTQADPSSSPLPQKKPAPANPPPTSGTTLPLVALSEKLLNDVLIAEIAYQRGQFEIAYGYLYPWAEQTRDPRLIRRSADIADRLPLRSKGLPALQLWASTEPNIPEAQIRYAGALLENNKLDEAVFHLKSFLARSEKISPLFWVALEKLSTYPIQPNLLLEATKNIVNGYPRIPEAHLTFAKISALAGQYPQAIASARHAGMLRGGWEEPIVLVTRWLARDDIPEAIHELSAFLSKYPNSQAIRLLRSRYAITNQQTSLAREDLEYLEKLYPGRVDILLSLAQLAFDAGDNNTSANYLHRVLATKPQDPNQVYFMLGQISSDQKQFSEARKWWQKIDERGQYLPAQIRVANTYMKEGQWEKGVEYLRKIPASSDETRSSLALAEVHLLTESNQTEKAYQRLQQAKKDFPTNINILYEIAMVAEKLGNWASHEENLRKIIAIKPDHAQAYNALGYSLADRNERLLEAKELIQKALSLSPDDPAIIDSMGWVSYRLEEWTVAINFLRRAYESQPDPEIAAHLGEVLWKVHQRSEAIKVWDQALQQNPNHPLLNQTRQRLTSPPNTKAN